MVTRILTMVGIVLALSIPASCQVSYVPLNLSAYSNFRLQDGDPAFPCGSVVLGGVPFSIPSLGNNEWSSQRAAGSNPRTLEVTLDLYSVVEVQTIMNTAWGQPGPNCYCWLEFIGSGGAYFRKDLIGNDDVRDYRDSAWTNNVNGITTVNVWSGGDRHRLDKQTITLPDEFRTQTLTRVRLTDIGADDFQRIGLYGLTVGVVPEPSTILALAFALTTLTGTMMRRRRQ